MGCPTAGGSRREGLDGLGSDYGVLSVVLGSDYMEHSLNGELSIVIRRSANLATR